MPSPSTLELRPAYLTTKIIMRINLSGTEIIAFTSINFGPNASDPVINNQIYAVPRNNGVAKTLRSPS